ncbi:MAG: endonuclease domain-containing protein [Acidimicrobiales bacterium]
MAACLAAGGSACASHRAAAALWAMRGFPAPPAPGSIGVEISSLTRRRPMNGVVVVHLARSLGRQDTTTLGGVPVTRVARTLYDLAAVTSPELWESAVEDSLLRRLVTLDRLRRTFGRLGIDKRWGAGTRRHILERAEGGRAATESLLEDNLWRLLARPGGPGILPVRQYAVRLPKIGGLAGRTVRLDFAYPPARVAVEADGHRWHGGRASLQRDHDRDNQLATIGWQVLRFTWDDVRHRPGRVLAIVAQALDVAA